MPSSAPKFRPLGRPALKAARVERRGTSAERGYDAEWTRFRGSVIADHPICELCWRFDKRATPTQEVDHVIPITGPDDPLRLDPADCRGLCRRHHRRKTRRLDRRIRGYFEKLLGDGLSYERARDVTIAKFRYELAA